MKTSNKFWAKVSYNITLLVFLWGKHLLAFNAYYEPFTALPTTCGTAGNWCLNFPYGQNGFMLVNHRGGGQTSYLSLINTAANYYTIAPSHAGYLFVAGMANDRDLAYNNIWTGRQARLETLYNASATQPFGFQIIRHFAVIDPADREDNDFYNRARIGVWLVQNNAVASETNFTASSPTGDWSTIGNAIVFYEMQINRDTSPQWGYFAGSDVSLNPQLSTAPRTNLSGSDDIGSGVNGLIFTNEDNITTHGGRFLVSRTNNTGAMATGCSAGSTTIRGYAVVRTNREINDVISNTTPTCGVGNRREVGIRMTHDGTAVRMYLNPNPYGRVGTFNGVNYTGYRNEWYRVATQNVPFNTNMKVMLGQEQLFFISGLTEAVFDNFLLRPVAQSVIAQITSPTQDSTDHRVMQGVAQQYEIRLNATFNAEDAGIGEIYIRKPSATGELFHGVNWNFSNVIVCLDNNSDASSGSACNASGEQRLIYRAGSDHTTNNNTLASNEFQAYTLNSDFTLAPTNTGAILAIRLKKSSATNNNVFRNTASGAHIRLYFTLTANNVTATGNDFQIWVHNEKFHDTVQEFVLDNVNGLRYATNERMLVQTAYGGALTVKAYTQPAATLAVSVSPNPLYWGDLLPFATLEIRTPTTGSPTDVTRLLIKLPPEGDTAPFAFTLKDGSIVTSLIDSLRIPDNQETHDKMHIFTGVTDTINDCTIATYYFCYYTNSANTNYRTLVVNYGNTYRIPGINGYDRLTFFLDQAPKFTANTQITTNWTGKVASDGFVTGTVPQDMTAFQGNPANMQTIVRASPPLTAGYVTPNVLSNNVANANPTTATLTYFVKNQGGPSNHIKHLELLIPYVTYNSISGDPGHPFTRENFDVPVAADFSNMKINGSAIVPAPTITVVGNENIGGTNYRVVRFTFNDAAKLNSGQTFSVNMNLKYYRNTNLSAQTFAIRHRADNLNYSTPPTYPYPQYTNGSEEPTASWEVTLAPPEPRGEAFVFRGTNQNDNARIFSNEIVSFNITNVKMKLYNRGGIGNNIDSINLYFPSYFTINDVCSSYLAALGAAADCASDGNSNIVVDNINHVININYSALSHPLKSSQDTITGTPCPGETNTPCEILTFTIAQNGALADPSLPDSVYVITDGNSDGIFETVTPGSDSQSTVRVGTFYAKLNNASGVTSYTRVTTGRSLNVSLEYPDPVLQAFVATNLTGSYEVDATEPSTTFKAYVKNTASGVGNNIYKVEIQFPTAPAIVSGVPNVVSLVRDHNGSLTTKNVTTHYTVNWNAANQLLTIQYTAGNELPPSLAMNDGTSYVDIIEIFFNDTVTTTGNRFFSVTGYNKIGTNITNKSVTASVYDGNDGDDNYNNSNNQDLALLYKIPPALATGTIEPKIAYTTTSTFTMQSKLFLQNKAPNTSTNRIFAVRLSLPAGVTIANAAAVTARSGVTITCSGGNGFTGGCTGAGEALELDYTTATPPYLDPANDADDEVLITWSHSLAAEGSLVFSLGFDNNDGNGFNGNLEPVPASLLTVARHHEPTMKFEVVSKPGDPNNPASMINNQTVDVTVPSSNYHRFKITVTPNNTGPKIHRLRITPPAAFDASTLDASDLLPAGTTMSASGGHLIVNFAGNQLTAASTVLEFRLRENRAFNTPGSFPNAEDVNWVVAADFYHDLFTNTSYSNANLPGPSFTGKLVADNVDDEIVYVPGSNFNTARPIVPVTGTGAAGLAWNQLRIINPAPQAVMYISPKEIFRINTGHPDYTWTQYIRVRNQGVLDNDIRLVDIKPPTGFLKTLGTVCNISGTCDITTTGITLRKGITGASEATYTTLNLGTHYNLSSVESGTSTYSLSVPHTLRITLSESARILHNETLVVSFAASHGITTTNNFTWTVKGGNYNASVPPINGSDPVPLGETLTTAVVTPSYTANFIVQSINGVAGASSIAAAATSNTFVFTLTNNSTGGDNLVRLRIAMPGYFNVSTATVTSQKGATVSYNASSTHYDTSGIESVLNASETGAFNRANYIQLHYTTPLPPGQSDTITMTIQDSFFTHTTLSIPARADAAGYIERSGNATEVLSDAIGNEDGICDIAEICEGGPISFKASAEYNTSGSAFNYIAAFPQGADRVSILQVAPVANAWLISSLLPLDGSAPRNQEVTLIVRNNASPATAAGNILYRAKIKVPREGVISGLSNIAYRKTGDTSFTPVPGSCDSMPTCSGAASGTASAYFIYLDFTGAGGLLPGEEAEVKFTITENLTQAGFIDLEVRGDNASAINSQGKPNSSLYIANNTSMNEGIALNPANNSQTLRLNFIPEDPRSEGYISYTVDPMIVPSQLPIGGGNAFVMDPKDLATLAVYCNPTSPNLADACDARFTVYAIGEYADIHYRLANGSQNFALEEAKIRLSIFDYGSTNVNWNQFEIVQVTSARLGILASPVVTNLDLFTPNGAQADDGAGSDGNFETKEITVNYSALPGGGIAVGQSDTIRIRLRLRPELVANHLTNVDTGSISYSSSGKASGFDISRNVEFKLTATVKRATVSGYRDVVVPNNQQEFFYVRRASFARITGLLAPDSAVASFTFRLQNADGTPASLHGGGAMPSVIARQEVGSPYGRFVFDRVPVGSGDFAVLAVSADAKFETQDYIRRKDERKLEKSLFAVSANTVTKLENILPGPYEVRYKQLNAALYNELSAPLNSRTRIILPPNALDNNPRINIRIEETAAQVWGVLDDAAHQVLSYAKFGIASPNSHKVYNLVNELPSGGVLSPVVENQLKAPATLILGYDPADFPAGSESRLAIFYWEMTRKQWIKLGGQVDTNEQTVTAEITYMHRTYTLLPADDTPKGISNVAVFPRVFTPGRNDSAYKHVSHEFGSEKTFGHLKLTFELGKSSIGSKYEVGIYSMNGKLIRKWERENTTGQGSIYWDGRDEFGGLVAGGVYVYVIRIGSEKYRGTLIVAR